MEQGEDGVLRKIPASVRLEILSVRNVGTLLQLYAFMLVLALINFSLIVALYVAVESLTSGSALQFLNLAKAYALVNVITNTSIYICILFLVLAYPQRILVRLFKYEKIPLPEQTLIILVIILFFLNPSATHLSLICSWFVAVNFLGVELEEKSILGFVERTEACITDDSVSGDPAITTLTSILTTLVLALFAFFFIVDKAALEAAKKQKAKRSGSHPGEDEDYGMTEQHSAYVFSCGTRKFLNSLYFYFCSAVSCAWCCCCKCRCCRLLNESVSVFRNAVSPTVMLSFCVYILYSIIASLALDYTPSAVPLVQIISVLKVCTSGDNYCARGTIGFSRALTQSVAFALELYIYVFLTSSEARRALRNLSLMPYAKHRAKHLGFQFYYNFTMTTIFFIMLMSTVVVSIKNPSQYVCNVNSTQSGCIGKGQPNALYVTGLDPNDPMFTTIYTLIIAWIFVLSSAYLPPDSYGFKGWWCPSKPKKHTMIDNLPTYSLYEASTGEDNSPDAEDGPPISTQIRNNVVSLETAVSLLNFSEFAYDKDVYAVDPEKGGEATQCVFDSRYTLVAVVRNEQTDINMVAFRGEDRLILSFRGTASKVNVKTDFDFTFLPYPVPKDLELEGTTVFDLREAFHQLLERSSAKVHAGFYKAYTSVDAQVLSLVRSQMMAQNNLAIICTGHSLGGAMACLAALSIRFSVGPDVALNVTSFGAPKMGNFTFKRFYNMVMPSTFRFVNVRDLVPALKNLCTRHQLQNVGHEVVLDFKKGNLIVAPNFIERALLLKFRTYSPQHHFVSRYALALMVWTARAHPEFQPVWSLDLCNGVTISCSESLEDLDDVTKRTIRKQVQRAGVEWKVKGEVLLRDMETQTEGLCECPPLELKGIMQGEGAKSESSESGKNVEDAAHGESALNSGANVVAENGGSETQKGDDNVEIKVERA